MVVRNNIGGYIMEKDKEKNVIDQLFTEDNDDISESVDYLKHVFGSVMDIIFREDNVQDNDCKRCRKKLV